MALWLILLLSAISATQPTDDLAKSEIGKWGSITGRVVFEGDLNDPRLEKYQQKIEVSTPERLNGKIPAQAATVPNESLLIDPKSRGVKNVFVYLRNRPERIYSPPKAATRKPIEVTFRDCRFDPHSLIVHVGENVRMSSGDENSVTNFNLQPLNNAAINPLVRPSKSAQWKPTTAERFPVRLSSNIFPSAQAHWLVVDHPYAVITSEDGSFRIDNLPVGEHELKVWQETIGYVEKKLPVKIRAGETTKLAPLKITVDRLK